MTLVGVIDLEISILIYTPGILQKIDTVRGRPTNELTTREICNPGDYTGCQSVSAYTPHIICYPFSQQQMTLLKTMHGFKSSQVFNRLWNDAIQRRCRDEDNKIQRLSIDEMEKDIWQPVLAALADLQTRLKNGTITLAEIDHFFINFGHKYRDISDELTQIGGKDSASWVGMRTRQIEIHHQVQSVVEGAVTIMKLRDTYKLTGDFKAVEVLSVKGEDYMKQPLDSMTDDMVRTGKALQDLNEERRICLEMFSRCKDLVEWIRKELRDIITLKAFVELSMRATGDGDLDIDRVTTLDQAVSGYAPLIYDLPQHCGSSLLLNKCYNLWASLSKDPHLPEKLDGTSRYLELFRRIQQSHGSTEETSIQQAKGINERGFYIIGVDHEEPGVYDKKLPLASCIQLKVLSKRGKQSESRDASIGLEKQYDINALNDLRSNLMLITHCKEDNGEIVDKFTEILDYVIRMTNTYIKLRSTGCVPFSGWKVTQACNPNNAKKKTEVTFSGPEKLIHEQRDATEQLSELCQFLDDCLKEWLDFIAQKRLETYELNHFTTEQIIFLRHELAKLISPNGTDDVDLSVFALLDCLHPRCTHADVLDAMRQSHDKPRKPSPNIERVESSLRLQMQHTLNT
ncbi:E3 ubiquitin-protein ligase rnf213-alpha-like [Glandiceps talaboti]